MKAIKGNKTLEIAKKELNDLTGSYETVIIDLGTGDGRFVYKTAKENPNKLVIGIDPSQKQLEIYSRKCNKEKLENALFVLGSVENLPTELEGIAEIVYINFPWGSLLGGIAGADEKVTENISSLVKTGGKLDVTFGYSQDAEPSEVKRLGLDNLTLDTIETEIVPEFEKNGLSLQQLYALRKEDMFKISSSWGKKLTFGQDRAVFRMVFFN